MSAIAFHHGVSEDLDAIAAIYNAGIIERVATFETGLRTRGDIASWLDADCLLIVATDRAQIVGFARASRSSSRRVYNGVGEHAVYLLAQARGRGLGRQLLDELARAAQAAGYYKLMSRIFTDNAASRAAHRSAGFVEVGIQRRHGRLDGAWKDCVLVERLLGDAAT